VTYARSVDTKAYVGVALLVASTLSATRWLAPLIQEILLILGWSLALFFWLRLRDVRADIKHLIEHEEHMIRELLDRKTYRDRFSDWL
jgi:hypothetical protein